MPRNEVMHLYRIPYTPASRVEVIDGKLYVDGVLICLQSVSDCSCSDTE